MAIKKVFVANRLAMERAAETPDDRKATPVFRGCIAYFPRALAEVSRVSAKGNAQHHPDKPLHWDKAKSRDHADALMRHLMDSTVHELDDDGQLHLGKVAWRALALLETYLEGRDAKQVAKPD